MVEDRIPLGARHHPSRFFPSRLTTQRRLTQVATGSGLRNAGARGRALLLAPSSSRSCIRNLRLQRYLFPWRATNRRRTPSGPPQASIRRQRPGSSPGSRRSPARSAPNLLAQGGKLRVSSRVHGGMGHKPRHIVDAIRGPWLHGNHPVDERTTISQAAAQSQATVDAAPASGKYRPSFYRVSTGPWPQGNHFQGGIRIADMERGYYGDHVVTVARHPSETDERMMVRLLAFALNAE